MKTSLLPLLTILLLAAFAPAADLTSIGDWTESINASALVSGAGSDLQPQFESVAGVTTLTISNAPAAWTLRVRLAGSGGHSDVTVHVKRASGGSGSGTISGGTAYQALTGSDAELFSGTSDRGSISLQFKLTGLTRKVSPATYLSSIIFTVSS
jgi:opacity protein-like surface antigen